MFTDKEKEYIRWLVGTQTFERMLEPDCPFSAKDIVQLGHSINDKLRTDGKNCAVCEHERTM